LPVKGPHTVDSSHTGEGASGLEVLPLEKPVSPMKKRLL